MLKEFLDNMSVFDILISLLIYFQRYFILPFMATNLPFLNFVNFHTKLIAMKPLLIASLSGLGIIFPIDTLFIVFAVIVSGELTLLTFKIGVFVLNLIRGSGDSKKARE